MSSLKDLMIKARDYYFKYFNISVSVSISHKETDIREITRAYTQVKENSDYNFIFGKMCVLSDDDLEKNKNNQAWGISEQSRKKLEESIKLNNINKVKNILDKIILQFSEYSYSNTLQSVMGLLNSIISTIDEMNATRIIPISIDYRSTIQSFYNAETIHDLCQQILSMVELINQADDEYQENNKNLIVVERVKKIVEDMYYDNRLCAITVSDELHFSPKYLSRIFKINVGVSIQEYINQIRLQNAIKLLENSKLSISDISVKIGIENENYFYTLFKKKYGVTSREYSLSRRIVKN